MNENSCNPNSHPALGFCPNTPEPPVNLPLKSLLLSLTLLLFLLTPALAQPASSPPPAPSQTTLGMNISGLYDWSTELPFVDAFKLARPWTSQQQGARYGQGPRLDMDPQGNVKALPAGVWAEAPMFSFPQPGHYPAGDYLLLYEGKGKFEFAHTKAASIIDSKPGRITVRVDPSKGGLFLKLSSVDPTDYPRNIRFLMPGFESTYQKDPWHPAFLARLQGFTSIRFMEATRTNLPNPQSWSERAQLTDATYTRRGMPYELCLDLCNRLKADPWLCIPHQADDQYVDNFAKLVNQQLDPSQKLYLEYSNELWNTMFPQNKYAIAEGLKRNFAAADKPWEAGWRFTAHRSLEIFAIAQRTLPKNRLVRVLASQTGNTFVSEQILRFKDAYKSADTLSTAPYISLMPRPDQAKSVTALGLDGLLDRIENDSLPRSIAEIKRDKALADKYGLKLTAYESGQHLVGIAGAENDTALTDLFHQANRHPRMGQIYTQYYQAWKNANADIMVVFNSVNSSSKTGSWGLMEYYDQDPFQVPKMAATLKFAKKLNQNVMSPP
jgi:hypothetical protein